MLRSRRDIVESDDNPFIQLCTHCGASIDTSDAEPLAVMPCPECGATFLARTQFHHFQLLEIMGSGGMGAVYRALDTNLDRPVALKLLRTEHLADPAMVAQFEREAAITASINHPHVVKIFSTGADSGTFYIALELVDKGSLDDLMTTLGGPISEAQVLEVGQQIAQGLQAAHRAGLIHRDVKPGNILFADPHTAKIVDFGLAALAAQADQIGGEIWGTPYYVAPEKLETEPQEDFRSDIYSLGSTLFHAIAGRPPYEAEEASIVVLKVLKSAPVSLRDHAPDVSDATAYVIDKMLEKNPDERYQSYESLLEHLQFARDEVARGSGRMHVPAPPPPRKSSPLLTFAIVALVVAAGIFAYLQWQPAAAPKEAAPARKVAVNPETQPRYEAARKLLLTGDPAEAARAATALAELDREDAPPALRPWITFHTGLARFLADSAPEASAAFRQLQERGPYSAEPAEEKRARFFVAAGTLAAGDAPIAIEAAEQFATGNHEALGLFLCGLKNWALGEFPAAAQCFGKFQGATPAEPDAWVAEYQPLAARYVADFSTYTSATQAATAVSAPEKKKDALAALVAARASLKLPSPLAARLRALEETLSAEVAAYEAELARKMAALDATDAATLAALQPKIDTFCADLRFAQALTALSDVQLVGEKAVPVLTLLRRKLGWLVQFKTNFFDDLRRAPYRGPLKQTRGYLVEPGKWQPYEKEVRVVIGPGSFIPVLWPDVAPDAMIAAAQTWLREAMTASDIADRQWGLGLYLLARHFDAQARPWLAAASAARPEVYREAFDQLGLAP